MLVSLWIYILYKNPSATPDQNLISAPTASTPPAGTAPISDTGAPESVSIAANDFLTLLLGVKNIKLEDAIFSDPAFQSLRDSSIVLVPDGNEGRPNPFAPLGQDIWQTPAPVASGESEAELEAESDQAESPAPNPDPLDDLEYLDEFLGEEDPGGGTI